MRQSACPERARASRGDYPERPLASRGTVLVTTVAAVALVAGFILGGSTKPLQGQAANAGFGAVAGYKG